MQLRSVESVETKDLRDADALIIAASIHIGKHKEAIRRFVELKHDFLNEKNTAFLSVSLSAAREETRGEAQKYLDDFLRETGWYPHAATCVAGALRYTRYGLVKRGLMKQIAAQKGLPTDTARDYEYTDWHQVREFTEEFLSLVPSPEAV